MGFTKHGIDTSLGKPERIAGTDSFRVWQLNEFTLSDFDMLSQLESCDRDNEYVFYTDGKLEYTDGINRCVRHSNPIIDTGTWGFNESQTELNISLASPEFQGVFDGTGCFIEELTDVKLRVWKKTTFNGIKTTVYVSFTRLEP